MNPIKVRILYSLVSILVAWCMAWTAGGTFSAGAGGGESSYEIEDDYSTDTTANYSVALAENGVQSLSVGSGVLTGTASTTAHWYHETALSSVNHYIQADCQYTANSNDAALIARCNGSNTFYQIKRGDATHYALYRVVSGTPTWCATQSGTIAKDNTYTLKLSVSGTGSTVTVTLDIDGVNVINYGDTNAARLTSGSYVGVRINNSSQGSTTVDNLIADPL